MATSMQRQEFEAAPLKWSDESDDESTSGGDCVTTDCATSSSGEEAACAMPPGTFANAGNSSVQAQPAQVFLMPCLMNGMQVLMPMVAANGGFVPATADQMQGVNMVAGSPQMMPAMQPMQPMQAMAMVPMSPQNMVCGSPTGFQMKTTASTSLQAVPAKQLDARAETLAAEAAELEVAARRMKMAAAKHARKSSEADKAAAAVVDVSAEDSEGPDGRTTLMFRNLPKHYSRSLLVRMLEAADFKKDLCFVYVPTDFKSLSSFGYAFVGFNTHEDASRAKAHFQDFEAWEGAPQDAQACDVAWSGAVQGKDQHIERYRNSPVMHNSVPDEYKPAVYEKGQRIAFPAPTKRVQPPRLRQNFPANLK